MNLAKKAIKAKADYIAFGAFNQSKTKKAKHVASVKILNKVKKFTKTPIVAIGWINAFNDKNLRDRFNQGLKAIRQDGTYDQIVKRYSRYEE